MLVSLLFKAENQASSIIKGVTGEIKSLTTAVNDATLSLAKLPLNAFGPLANGFTSISNAITATVDTIEGQFAKAQSLQQQFVGNASSLAAQTGRSFTASYDLIKGINNEITRVAAPLPGETQAYKDISNQLQGILIRGYVDKKGDVDEQGFGKGVIDLSTNYGALGMGKGINQNYITMFLQRALQGESMNQLSQIEFGKLSPEVINAIKAELRKQGLSELSAVQGLSKRAEILASAAKPFVNDEFKSRSANTVEGVTRSFQTNLFDPRVGVFGLFREVDDKGTGIKNGIEAYTKFLSVTIGEKGLFTKLGEFAKVIGIYVDPIQVLHDAFLLFSEGALILSNGIDAATKAFKQNGGIFPAINAFFQTVSSQIMADLGITSSSIQNIDLFGGLNNFINEIPGMINSGIKVSNDFISGLDTLNAGRWLGKVTDQALVAIGVFLSKIDWLGLVQLIGVSFYKIGEFFYGMGEVMAKDLTNAIGEPIMKITQSIIQPFVDGWNYLAAIPGQIQRFFTGTDAEVTGRIAQLSFNFGESLGWLIYKGGEILVKLTGVLLVELWNLPGQIAGAITSVPWGDISLILGKVLVGLTVSVGAALLGVGSGIIREIAQPMENFSRSIFMGINSIFDAIINGFNNAINFIKSGIQTTINDTISKIPGGGTTASIAGNVLGSFIPGGNLISAGQQFLSSMMPKYMGNIPNAANGLLGAASAESQNMPLGANLVMANNKEFILAPSNKSLNAYSQPSKGGVNISFQPTININGMDKSAGVIAQELADNIINVLHSRIETELMGNLT